LIAEAKAEWERIIPQLLRFRLIAELDTASLSLYCQAYGRWQQAEKSIADMAAKTSGDGMLIKAPSGYPIQNPYLAIANRAMEDCNKYLQAFGLSPSARAKVTPANQQLELFAGTSEWSSL
jgi:P27 family predicted phage terminase small subunit